jgi:phage shock protein C
VIEKEGIKFMVPVEKNIKKLYRSKHDKMIGGICGGLGSYLAVDPTIIRLLMIIICILTVILPLVIGYLIAMLIIPVEEEEYPLPVNYTKFYRSVKDRKIAGICGGLGEMTKIDPVFLRLLFIFLCVVTGVIPLLLAYLIGWIIIPEKA